MESDSDQANGVPDADLVAHLGFAPGHARRADHDVLAEGLDERLGEHWGVVQKTRSNETASSAKASRFGVTTSVSTPTSIRQIVIVVTCNSMISSLKTPLLFGYDRALMPQFLVGRLYSARAVSHKQR